MSEEESIGTRISRLAAEAASESAFAREVGISVQTLRSYMRGGSIPGTDKLAKIARAGHVSIEWLATGRESAESEKNFNTCSRFELLLAAWDNPEIRCWLHPELVGLERRLLDLFPDFAAELKVRR